MQSASPSGPSATPASSSPREAEPTQVAEWMRSRGALLFDVREADEHARERIAGATLVPLSRFDAGAVKGAAHGGATIVLHCRSGRRSADAARMLMSAGVPAEKLVSMRGGIEAWKQSGLPVEVDTKVSRISILRQVQLVVGSMVLAGSAMAWLVHPAFLIVPAFFGSGLMFAGASGTCGMALMLERMPWNRAARAACAPTT